jgi:hypothetical protein
MTAIKYYELNDDVKMAVAFTNSIGAAADPQNITLIVIAPSGTRQAYVYGSGDNVMQRSGVGGYFAILPVDEYGDWEYRFRGYGSAGTIRKSVVRHFTVRPTKAV